MRTMPAKSIMRKNVNHAFSFWDVFWEGFAHAISPSLLSAQALVLIILIFALLTWTGFMGLGGLLLSIMALSFSSLPLVLFVVLFGLVLWILGIMAINAFVQGIEYHLAMQSVTRKPIDLNLAWKLASARWKDAFIVQGCFSAIIITAFIISSAAIFFFSPEKNILLVPPLQWIKALAIAFAVLTGVLVALQPFLLLLLPTVYFENVSPAQVFARIHSYVRRRYVRLLAVAVGIIAINMIIGSIADMAYTIPIERTLPFSIIVFAVVATIIQLLVILFTFTLTVCIQTLLYLHVGKPKTATQFVSTGIVGTALSRMTPENPHYSGRLPVKWKSPRKRK
ncbi:MAG: hypothetical protein V1776_02970 [Candidatus Diapherotrites archaeon]